MASTPRTQTERDTQRTGGTRVTTTRRGPAWLAADAVGVVLFAAAGRRSHAEGLDAAGIASTAAPFLAGAAIGWLLSRAWRNPSAIVPTGLIVWPSTVIGGMLIRRLSGEGTAPSFVIVATLVTGVVLLGWRALASRR